MTTAIGTFLTPLVLGCVLQTWIACPAKALFIVGGTPLGTATPDQGIGVGGEGRGYVFITSRHFLVGHAGPPLSVNGIAVVDQLRVSTLQSDFLDEELRVAELASDLPGVTPLPIAYSPILGDYVNLDLRVFGSAGADYGYQNSGASPFFTMNNDAGVGGPPPPATITLPIIGLVERAPGVFDALMFVDIRGTGAVTYSAFLQSGDSNGALVVELPGGVLAAMGTALAIGDIENPLGGPITNFDYNVYNFAGFYQTQIQNYLAARSTALGQTYSAQFIPLPTVIPEPTRALTLAFGLAALLFQRRRSQ